MHISVLLEETIDNLNLKDNSIIVDCTLGYGGHSSHILKQIPNGFLYAFEQDKQAIEKAKHRLETIGQNFEIINTNFKNIQSEISNRIDKVDGILFDLGVSSPQLDVASRGFSFHQDGPLDMRMNLDNNLSAYDVVNKYTFEQLTNIFFKYGEEKYAKSIARGIIRERERNDIKTTLELTEIIKNNVPEKYRRLSHPARKVFQAIRIEVNDELNIFEKALKDSLKLIAPGGRICVITFHSLEDKICKRIFKEATSIPVQLQKAPIIPESYKPKFKQICNIVPSSDEINKNKRARSARLRVIERG